MSDEVEQLSNVLDALVSERDPVTRADLTTEEVRLARTAAFLRAAEPARLVPSEAFVASLASHLHERRSAVEEVATGPGVQPGLSRRGALRRAVAAVAGLAAAGAGGGVVYEEGKRSGYREEADAAFGVPLAPTDRGVWMDSGYTAQDIAPGGVVRFRAGAVEGFLVNPGSDGRVYALSAACTHMGCMLTWLTSAGTFLCPCHGAQYNPDGTVLSGIARHPLPRLPVHLGADGRYRVWSVPAHPKITTLLPYDDT